ncbi:GP46-like surface antigen, putative, partial [Bodo saltans]
GSLPPEWSSMYRLSTLSIFATNVSGTLPSTWSSMTGMSYLLLHSNPLLNGTLPPVWSSMSQLKGLYIFGTNISGTLPSSWSSMTRLMDFGLYPNPMLSGNLPIEWSSMSNLMALYIYKTNVSGTLPSSWGNMTAMKILHSVAIAPSTAASATLLLARLGTSECVASDVVLGIVGLALSTLPAAGFLLLWALSANRWTVTARDREAATTFHPLVALLNRTLRRRWEWTTTEGGRKGMERAWPLLLEYRELRYGAVDNGVLLALSIVSVVSGLSGSSGQCRGWSLVALLLLVAQLVAVIIVQPLTTTFSQLYAISTVSLTCLGVLAQLLFVWTVDSLWLVDATAACSLAVVGLSLLNTALNAVQLVAAVPASMVLFFELRLRHAQISVGPDHQNDHLNRSLEAVDLLCGDKSLSLELDAAMLMMTEDADGELYQPLADGLFWKSDGAAVGTELVEGHSDIIRTDALVER